MNNKELFCECVERKKIPSVRLIKQEATKVCQGVHVRDRELQRHGIESRWGGDILLPSRLAPGPTQPPINGYWVFPGGKAAGAWR